MIESTNFQIRLKNEAILVDVLSSILDYLCVKFSRISPPPKIQHYSVLYLIFFGLPILLFYTISSSFNIDPMASLPNFWPLDETYFFRLKEWL